ncbi:MAG TPA: hypothetical protein VMR74_17005 [Gammaproteobacteria bacterium]|nr:hypothetical protein [Gammaproteobacteria bacterium]
MASEKSQDTMEQVEDSRRDFLKKAAQVAVYTPPAMLIMSRPSYATFNKTGGQDTYTHTSSSYSGFFSRLFRSIASWFH